MTSIAFNTTTPNTNALISLSSNNATGKKSATEKNFISYSFLPKASARKSTTRLSSIDWDLNSNELEFE